MHRLRLAAITLTFTVLAAVAAAQVQQPRPQRISRFTPCTGSVDGLAVVALDPVDGDDCGTGGGTAAPHLCVCDGTTGTYQRPQRESLVWERPYDRLAIGPGDDGTLVVVPVDGPITAVTAEDDGRSRGGGAVCSATFCSTTDCTEGQGDCANTDSRCVTGLFCRQNVGRLHNGSLTPLCTDTDDICLPESTWCAYPCSPEDPCAALQGDCAGSDANCEAGLICGVDQGATWDCGATVDVCRTPTATCNSGCSAGDPCFLGEGDCAADDGKCSIGMHCAVDAGAYHGCGPTVDICEANEF